MRYWLGSSVFDQRGGGADFAGEEVGGFGSKRWVRLRLSLRRRRRRAAWAFTFQAGPVAASRSLSPRSRTSATGWESRRETCVSRVRALTIWPSEVLVAKGQQVAGDVEGAGFEGAFVGFGLHGLRAGDAAGGELRGRRRWCAGRRRRGFRRSRHRAWRRRICSEVREIPAGLAEVLVAGGAFLTVPALLVDQHDGGEEAEALDGEGDVGQVGDGAVAVLEIEGVQELLGALGADFGERLAHGERGTRILGHGVGQDFGVGSVNGKDIGLVTGAGGQEKIRWTLMRARDQNTALGLADEILKKWPAFRCKVLKSGRA